MAEYIWKCETILEVDNCIRIINNLGKENACVAKMTIDDRQSPSFILENIRRLIFLNTDDVISRLAINFVPEEFLGKEHENGCDECFDDPCCMRLDECMTRKEKLNEVIRLFYNKIRSRISTLFLIEKELPRFGILSITDGKINIRDPLGQHLLQHIFVYSDACGEYPANFLCIKNYFFIRPMQWS